MFYNKTIKKLLSVLIAAGVMSTAFLGALTTVKAGSGESSSQTVVNYDFEDDNTHAISDSDKTILSIVKSDMSSSVQNEGILTLDALNSRFKSYDTAATGRVNGIKIGEKQGIHLEENTKYALTFEYRLDEIIRPNNDIGCSYDCRMPLFYVYKNGRDPVTVNFDRYKSDGTFMDTKGFQNPWQLTIGKWYSYTLEFETATNVAGSNAVWFAPISYGGMKGSYRNLKIVGENNISDNIDFSKLSDIPEYADLNTPTYNDTNKNTLKSFPQISVIRTGNTPLQKNNGVMTLNALGSRYTSYDSYAKGRVNGVKLGKEHGINLSANTTYKLTFEYCVDEIMRPGNDIGCSYDCRSPLFFVYKDGKTPSTVVFDRYQNDGTIMPNKGFQDPWQLSIGQWYTYTLEFKTDSSIETNSPVWLAPISYGGMKSSYRNLRIFTDGNMIADVNLGEIGNIPSFANVNTPTYNDSNKNTAKSSPEIAISQAIGTTTGGTNEDHCLLIDASANTNQNIKPGITINTDYGVKSKKGYTVEFDYYINNEENSGNAFGLVLDGDSSSSSTVWFENASKGKWEHSKTDFAPELFNNIKNPNSYFSFIIATAKTKVYIDNFVITEHTLFDEDTIPAYQELDFEEDGFVQSGKYRRITAAELPNSSYSNGSQGYLMCDNSGNTGHQYYHFNNFNFKSNSTYEITVDYYVSEPYHDDWRIGFGYNATNLGIGNGMQFVKFSLNESSAGWKTIKYTLTTGTVVHNQPSISLAVYPGKMVCFDNITLTQLCNISAVSADLKQGEVTGGGGFRVGESVTLKAIPLNGCEFIGWYENGVKLDGIGNIYSFSASENRKLEARFSGRSIKPNYFIQNFEDLKPEVLMENCFEICDDPSNSRSGNKSLHILPNLLESGTSNRFVPLLSNLRNKFKGDTEYEVYFWVKMVTNNESSSFFSVVEQLENPNAPGTYTYNILKAIAKPIATSGDGTTDGEWFRVHLGTLRLSDINSDTIMFHMGKYTPLTSNNPSIDEFYIDDIEIVENVVDFEKKKFCYEVVDMFENGNFENGDQYWADLLPGMSVDPTEQGAPEWQLKNKLVINDLSGRTYEKTIAVRENALYTVAFWARSLKSGNFRLQLNSNLGQDGMISQYGDGSNSITQLTNEWKRYSITVETTDGVNSLSLLLTNVGGTVEIDNLNMYIAGRGYETDPNTYFEKTPDVVIVNGDGTTDGEYVTLDSVKTGDDTNPFLWTALVLTSAIVMFGSLKLKNIYKNSSARGNKI